jgi:hypothetical protein
MTETADQRFINIGQKVLFNWENPNRGYTTGTVSGIKRGKVVVSWDDGTTTESSKEWYFKFVREQV